MRKKILLAGYYGFGNLGDEILLEIYRSKLRGKFDISVLLPRRYAHEENAVDRWSPLQVFRAMTRCNILLFGGGGVFQDKSGALSFWYYIFLISLALMLQKKVALLAQGVGPLSPFHLFIAKSLFCRAHDLSVRDQFSLNLLQGVPARLSADSALLYPAEPAPLNREENIPIILFIPREGSKTQVNLEEGLSAFIKNSGGRLETLPFQSDPALNGKEVFRRLNAADMIISMRLHGLIFSALLKKPFVGVAIDPKIESFVKEFDFSGEKEPLIRPETDSSEKIIQILERAWKNHADLSHAVEKALPALQARAADDFERLTAL